MEKQPWFPFQPSSRGHTTHTPSFFPPTPICHHAGMQRNAGRKRHRDGPQALTIGQSESYHCCSVAVAVVPVLPGLCPLPQWQLQCKLAPAGAMAMTPLTSQTLEVQFRQTDREREGHCCMVDCGKREILIIIIIILILPCVSR